MDDRRGLTRRGVAVLGVALLLLASAEIGTVLGVRHLIDSSELVDQLQLSTALVSFRPPDRPGARRDVVAADLGAANAVRSDPASCAPLTLLTTRTPRDGQSWTGISGNPAQPVTTLTARFDTVGQARSELWEKRRTLLTCRSVRLTFPPFRDPAQDFSVRGRFWPPSFFRADRIDYALTGGDKRYDFYVRRYANTITWSYGDPDGAQVRRRVVDDLADRLAELGGG